MRYSRVCSRISNVAVCIIADDHFVIADVISIGKHDFDVRICANDITSDRYKIVDVYRGPVISVTVVFPTVT